MFTNLDSYVNVLSTFNISANQFLLCYLLYTDERDSNGSLVKRGTAIANLYKYASKCPPWTKAEIRDLVDKGYLVDPNYYKDDTFPDYLEVTDKFKNHVFIQEDRFEALWEAYPRVVDNFSNPNGPRIKLQMCDKASMRDLYMKKVKSKVKHHKIMELVKWAHQKGEINFSFENFIRGEAWNTLEEIREKGSTNVSMEGRAV